MITRTRVIVTTEYIAHCEVCGVRIIVIQPGEPQVRVQRLVGSSVELCPDCADEAKTDTLWQLEEDWLGAINGTLNA